MANFDKAVEWVLRLEDSTLSGKIVDLKNGAGLTRYGITSKNHPDLMYGSEIYIDPSTIDVAELKNTPGYTIPADASTSSIFAAEGPSFFSEFLSPELALPIAKECYRQEYWEKIRGDEIESNEVAATLLSFAVNDGVVQAVRELQQLLSIPPTGFFGPRTLTAVNRANPPSGLALGLRYMQKRFYESVVGEHPEKARFLKGWLARADAVYSD